MFGWKVPGRCSKSCIGHDIVIWKLARSFPVSLLHGDTVMQKSGGCGCDDMKTKAVSELSILFNVLVKGCALFTYE